MSFIKAIETSYNGYRFRSRLEARWAVFFDAFGLTWEYESEGFAFDGLSYLPDFKLINGPGGRHDPEVWAECKPDNYVTERDMTKVMKFAQAQHKSVLVLLGSPWYRNPPDGRDSSAYQCVEFTHIKNGSSCCIEPKAAHIIECQCCGDIGTFTWPNETTKFSGKQKDIFLKLTRTPKLIAAYTAARSARFEHGETPRMP